MKNSCHDLIIITTTTETRGDAEKIAAHLVKKRLAACAQVSGPITSYYWWENKLEKDQEWRCVIKTVDSKYGEVEKEIKIIHPYSVPQIVAVSVKHCLQEYETWAKDNVSP
jgi:periplasmic divalent cation tolerance protein